jgi:isopenicillin N synthase-like dioxygenase
MSGAAVPVIDIAGWTRSAAEKRAIAAALDDALTRTGFVAVLGHGVDEALVRSTYAAVTTFFALPVEEKRRFEPPEPAKTRGYLRVGIESVAATLDDARPADLCEALVFRSLLREARPQGGVGNIYPDRPAGLRQSVQNYFEALAALAARLNRIAAAALGLPETYFDAYHRDPGLVLRFVNYPEQPEAPLPGQLRYGAHHDYGGLTILRQDDAPGGLQICDTGGCWHDVPPVPGGFVINVGDLMSRWTNSRWRSTLHRVVNPPRDVAAGSRRLSMVMFTAPDDEAEIACLPSCCDAAHPARYEPVRAGLYVQRKIEASMLEVGAASRDSTESGLV